MSPALLLLLACTPDPGGDSGAAPDDGVAAIVAADRSGHLFDRPWPSDELLIDGRPDLSAFPRLQEGPLAPVLEGWIDRLEQVAWGHANNGAAYFRFEGPLPELPATTEGDVDDPVLWVVLGQTPALLPLDLRFVEDPLGDPFWAENTLVVGPSLGHPPPSGATVAAVVMASAGARPPEGYVLPDGVQQALDTLGVPGPAAVATVFSAQDAVGELQALRDDVDRRLGEAPDWSEVVLQRVVRLQYSQGQTPSGQDATLATATFEDGSTETAFLAPLSSGGEHTVELDESWPMEVYQASIPTLNYSGLEDRPYMSPGLAHLADVDRTSGWIHFERDGDGGLQVASEPDAEPMRITVSLPRGGDGLPLEAARVALWDHGTGGHAYNAVQRRHQDDDGRALAERWAAAGVAVIGRDAPLYGTRYPLIDEGYGASLGFYNIVNLPAFRDNQRQAAVDGHVLLRFVQTGLAERLPRGGIDPSTPLRGGHSLGSVTANLGVAMEPEAFEGVLLSGSGGVFAHYFLDTGLLGTSLDESLLESLFALFGVPVPDEVTPASALGAAMGLPEEAWGRIDRFHPAMQLFQWTMDASDPMAVAGAEALPATMIIGAGDWQVPDFTSEALCDAGLPDCARTTVEADGDYDPHYVLHRTQEGFDLLEDWLSP